MAVRGRKKVTSLRTREHLALMRALELARENLSLSRRALARRMGMYDNFVSKVESGGRMLDVVEFIWYAKGLGVDPGKLIAVAL